MTNPPASPASAPTGAELDQAYQAAVAAHGAGDFARAAPIYDALLGYAPNHPALLLRRGVLARQIGDRAGAVSFLTKAAAFAPEDAEVHSNLGNALADLGDPAARAAHLRAASLAPAHIGVLLNCAGYLIASKDAATATPMLESVVDAVPGEATAWGLLGDGLRDLGQIGRAEAAMRRALALNPHDADRWYNLGNLLHLDGAFGQAEPAFRRALELRPNHPPTLTNLGLSLRWTDEALALHERALALDPGFLVAEMNRAVHLLRVGDQNESWSKGWAAYEVRHRMPGALRRDFDAPTWAGEALSADQPLLIWSEQGAGDVFFMLRFLPAAMARATTVILELHPGLGALAPGLPAGVTVIERGAALPAFARQISTTSLPRVIDAPVSFPYVEAPPAALARWARRFLASARARVGLVWAGNPLYPNDRLRSCALAELAPLLKRSEVDFYSLQVGAGRDQLADAPGPATLIDLADDLTDFGETAAALRQLDLLISVDTATLNLAGALATQAWAILAPNTDWRWGAHGETTSAYPSLRLFRRLTTASGDAEPRDAVIARIDAALADWLRTRQTQEPEPR